MNYIKQLSNVIEKFSEDDRLNTAHVSLYLALFQMWNLNRFKNPISINRAEVMKISKIGSKGTYHRCLNDLNNSSRTSIGAFNKHNKHNKTNINTNSKELVNTQNENEENFNFKKKKIVSKKVETNTPKNLEEVEAYFLEKEKPKSEANKFFNFYEANGWMVGKNKMKNWRAAANNWMANIGKYNPSPKRKTNLFARRPRQRLLNSPLKSKNVWNPTI
jgi:hypothetical protein